MSPDENMEFRVMQGTAEEEDMSDEPVKHTPTPWHTESTSICSEHWRIAYCIGYDPIIPGVSIRECHANAEFIVRACNYHDALLDALKGLSDLLSDLGFVDENGRCLSCGVRYVGDPGREHRPQCALLQAFIAIKDAEATHV